MNFPSFPVFSSNPVGIVMRLKNLLKLSGTGLSFLFVIAAIVGCASSTITSRQEYQGGKIARPDHIIVYDFAATPADVPADSAIAANILNIVRHKRRSRSRPAVRWALKSQKFWLRISAAWDCRQSGLRVKLRHKLAIL